MSDTSERQTNVKIAEPCGPYKRRWAHPSPRRIHRVLDEERPNGPKERLLRHWHVVLLSRVQDHGDASDNIRIDHVVGGSQFAGDPARGLGEGIGTVSLIRG